MIFLGKRCVILSASECCWQLFLCFADGILQEALQRNHRGRKEQEGQRWKLGLGPEEPMRAWIGFRKSNKLLPSSRLSPKTPQPSICGRKEYSPDFSEVWHFFHWWWSSWRLRWPCGLPENTCSGIPLIPMGQASWRDGKRDFLKRNVDIMSILADNYNPQGAVEKQKNLFFIKCIPYCIEESFKSWF